MESVSDLCEHDSSETSGFPKLGFLFVMADELLAAQKDSAPWS